MSYLTYESSVQDGRPLELYEFRRGSLYFRYALTSESYYYQGLEFQPEYIKRGSISQTEDLHKGGMRLIFPLTNTFAAAYLGLAPDDVTTVTIYRGHIGDADGEFVAYWKGRVLSAKADGNEITMECESIFSSMARAGLRSRFELTCRHSLYSAECTLSRSSYAIAGTVVALSGNVLTIAAAAGYPDGYFVGGMIENGSGDFRFITSHVGSLVTISRPFNVAVGSTDVTLYPGCDKAVSTCITKFNNLLNFGGFPYIPSSNPFDGGIA